MIIIERADNTAAIITQSAANKLPERPVNTSFDARRVNLHADFSVFSTPEWKCVRILKTQLFPSSMHILVFKWFVWREIGLFCFTLAGFSANKTIFVQFRDVVWISCARDPTAQEELTLESNVFRNDRMLPIAFRSLKKRLKTPTEASQPRNYFMCFFISSKGK